MPATRQLASRELRCPALAGVQPAQPLLAYEFARGLEENGIFDRRVARHIRQHRTLSLRMLAQIVWLFNITMEPIACSAAGGGITPKGTNATNRNLQDPPISTALKLAGTMVDQANRYAHVSHRSVPKQIGCWSQIGRIAEENPDLPFSMIGEILIADQEEPVGEYQFG